MAVENNINHLKIVAILEWLKQDDCKTVWKLNGIRSK
jgi:hypothetical protein